MATQYFICEGGNMSLSSAIGPFADFDKAYDHYDTQYTACTRRQLRPVVYEARNGAIVRRMT